MARSTDQVVEVIPLMDGEDSPRRVLCPWRAHPPASTLPAVARATAGRFVRCEWLVGRVVCVPRGPASGFCVSCSPHGWPSVVRGLGHWRASARESAGPPISRLSRTRSAKRALHRASRAARSARRLRRPHHQEATRAVIGGGQHAGARARSAQAIGAERVARGGASWHAGAASHTLGGLCLLANSNKG